jgi:hypothetical protein
MHVTTTVMCALNPAVIAVEKEDQVEDMKVVETEDHSVVQNAKADMAVETVIEVETEGVIEVTADLVNAEVQVRVNADLIVIALAEVLPGNASLMVIAQTEDLQRSANPIATVKELHLKGMKILLQKKATQKTNRVEEEIEKVISQEKDVLENNSNLIRL